MHCEEIDIYIKMISSFGGIFVLIHKELYSTRIIFIFLNHYRNILTTFWKETAELKQGQTRAGKVKSLIHNGNRGSVQNEEKE